MPYFCRLVMDTMGNYISHVPIAYHGSNPEGFPFQAVCEQGMLWVLVETISEQHETRAYASRASFETISSIGAVLR